MKAVLITSALALSLGPVHAQQETRSDYSQAERLLLMTNQMSKLKPGTELSYQFSKQGSAEAAFTDRVTVSLRPLSGGACCVANSRFLTGEHAVQLPDVEKPDGNPVTLYFLEHDIRDMKRLTKGSINYFRKRIRMALSDGAQVRDVRFSYQGKPVSGQEIVLIPYKDDPNSAKFPQWTGKRYRFVLSPQVPGTVAGISTRVEGTSAEQPLWIEDMVLTGVDLPPMPAKKAPTGATTGT